MLEPGVPGVSPHASCTPGVFIGDGCRKQHCQEETSGLMKSNRDNGEQLQWLPGRTGYGLYVGEGSRELAGIEAG